MKHYASAKSIHQIRQRASKMLTRVHVDNTGILKWSFEIAIQTASHQTAPWTWKYTQLTSSPSLTLPLQTGLSRPEKELSQQLWLNGHQRKCQKQFLTLGCSQWIFYLFDLKLTHLLHISGTSKHVLIIWFKLLLPVFLFRCARECCSNTRLVLGPQKKFSQIAAVVAQKAATPLILHLHTLFSRLPIEEKDQPINCFLFLFISEHIGSWICNFRCKTDVQLQN